MKKLVLIVFLLGLIPVAFAQKQPSGKPVEKKSEKLSDSLVPQLNAKKVSKNEISAKNYVIISFKNDTTYVDTSLTIRKNYKINTLRRDYFDLLPFANTGQTFNSLSFSEPQQQLMPLFAARAKHFNYLKVSDIYYYDVPTPFTELFYKSVFTQGQVMKSFFTVNTSRQLNLSVGYNALRSVGKYQNSLSSIGNFWLTGSYKTKNKRYILNAHFIGQDIMNRENGGITNDEVVYFETGEPEYLDRGVFALNFQDASTMLNGKRAYVQQQFNVFNTPNSKTQLRIKHNMEFEDKYFRYEQATANTMFGDAFQTKNIKDVTNLERFYHKVQLQFSNKTLGHLAASLANENYNYGYDKALVLNNNYIPNRLKGDATFVGASYSNTIGAFKIQGNAATAVGGRFKSNYFNGKAAIRITNDIALAAALQHSSRVPNYNMLLNQSAYTAYNWNNTFKNINTQQLHFELTSKKLLNASVDVVTINNYMYYAQTNTDSLQTVKPFQSGKPIAYLKAKASKNIRIFKHLALDNTLLYQTVSSDENVLNLPELLTRNTLYYSNHVFKKALYLQTGVTFSYFTKYFANAYNPVLSEFYIQNNQQIGDYPRLDFFIDGKIRTARIYFKVEHLNSRFTGFNYYAAPNYPYRDFVVRFGVVWNFFL